MFFRIGLLCVGVLVVAARGGGDGGSPSQSTATVVATTQPVMPQASAGPSSDSESIDVRATTIGAPVPFPAGVALIIEVGCWQCDGDPGSLVRIYRGDAGALRETTLIGGARLPHSVSPDGSQIAFAECTRGTCDGFNPTSVDVQSTISWSHDGGITSESFPPLDGLYFASTVVRGMLLATGQTADSTPLPMRRYPGGHEFAVPSRGDEPTATGWDQVSFLAAGRSRILLGPDVEEFDLGEGRRIDQIAPEDAAGTRLAISWNEPAPDGNTRSYVSIVALDDGRYRLQGTYAVDSGAGHMGWVDADTLVGTYIFRNADLPTHGSRDARGSIPLPALFDLKAGVLHPIIDPFLDDTPYARGRNFVLAAIRGSFARVVNTGSCLNLRSEPRADAPAKSCAADEVLLRLPDHEEAVGGTMWLLVAMPDGTDGWVSSEFVAR